MNQTTQLRYSKNLKTSSYLSQLPLIGWEQSMDVKRLTPSDLIPVMRMAKVDFVLVGAHGISGWLQHPRATEDVDFLIRIRDKRKASEKIIEKYPDFITEDCPDVVRFKLGKDCLVDLMLTRTPFYKRIFDEFHEVKIDGFKIKVPKLEAGLAMKFAAMTGHYRNAEKKHYDAGDFTSMVRRNVKIDLTLLRELAELLYSGAGNEAVQYVADVHAGKTLSV